MSSSSNSLVNKCYSGEMAERSADKADTPAPKRKQKAYEDHEKIRVVYKVIVEEKTIASMNEICGVPESTARGWVKPAKAYLKKAKEQGRNVELTNAGFFEDEKEIPTSDIWKTTSSPLALDLSLTRRPSVSIGAIPTPDLLPTESSEEFGHSAGASSSTVDSKLANLSMAIKSMTQRPSVSIGAIPTPDLLPTESSEEIGHSAGASSSTVDSKLANLSMAIKSMNSAIDRKDVIRVLELLRAKDNHHQRLEEAFDSSRRALNDLQSHKRSMNENDTAGLLMFIDFIRKMRNRLTEESNQTSMKPLPIHWQ